MITERIIDWSIDNRKSDSGEPYSKVSFVTPTIGFNIWIFPNGPAQKQKDDYIKLKSATQQFKTKPLTVTYEGSEFGVINVVNYNQ